MDNEQKDIFKKINQKEDQLKLLNDLVNQKSTIVCKGSGDDIFSLIPKSVEAGLKIKCSLKLESLPPKMSEDQIIGQFILGNDKYFIYSELLSHDQSWILDGANNLYQLQRRQSYRIRVPSSYNAKIELVNINTKQVVRNGRLFDMSSGGVRLTLPTKEVLLTEGDRVECQLQIGRRESLSLKGQIRHVRPQKILGAEQMIGIQFTPITAIMENKLFAMTMELHREFFAKKAE